MSKSAPREISGNYTLADAYYVAPHLVGAQCISWTEYVNLSASGLEVHCKGGGHFDAQLVYAKCIDDERRPVQHVGDWPVAGQWYLTRFVHSRADGIVGVRILDFIGEAPYFNSFSHERFDFQGPMPFICLN